MSGPRFVGITAFRLGGAAFAVDEAGAVTDVVIDGDPEAASRTLARRLAGREVESWDGRHAFGRRIGDALSEPWNPCDIVLAPRGEELERRVWKIVATIPYATTRTYLEVAAALPPGTMGPVITGPGFANVPKPADQRDVAYAASLNPIDGLIPCHRLVRADRKPAGHGPAAEIRRAMLARELESRTQHVMRIAAQARRTAKEERIRKRPERGS